MMANGMVIFSAFRLVTGVEGGGGGRQRWDSTKTPVSAISGTEVGQGSKPVLTPRLALA